jgi:hypothetical protein
VIDILIWLATALFTILFWAYALFLFFLAYVPVKQAHDDNTLSDQATLMVWAAKFTVYVGLVIDIGFNVLLATFIFVELPTKDTLTFTARCKKWKDDAGYRGAIVRWVCRSLNLYQKRHCW